MQTPCTLAKACIKNRMHMKIIVKYQLQKEERFIQAQINSSNFLWKKWEKDVNWVNQSWSCFRNFGKMVKFYTYPGCTSEECFCFVLFLMASCGCEWWKIMLWTKTRSETFEVHFMKILADLIRKETNAFVWGFTQEKLTLVRNQ